MSLGQWATVQSFTLSLVLAACGSMDLPPEFDRPAREYIRLVRVGNVDSAIALLDSTQGVPDIRSILAEAQAFLDPFNVDSATAVGWNVQRGVNSSASITYELRGEGRTALVAVGVIRHQADVRITGLSWETSAAPLAELNAFTLNGRSLVHYLFLVLAVGAAGFSIGVAVLALVKKVGLKWVLLSLVGTGQVAINWTTGEQSHRMLTVQLFSASATRAGDLAPWFVSFSLPIGAIITLLRWRAYRSRTTQPEGADPPVAAT